MCFGSRRPPRVLLINVRNQAARVAWAGEHTVGSVDVWKRVAQSGEIRFQQLNAAGRLRIWHQAHEAMDSACQFGTV
ncbi:transposable element Tc1 transposase [Trichonephila clavipes]|nr:transposable element Tc1 transposase [Trichonephila clavipes]